MIFTDGQQILDPIAPQDRVLSCSVVLAYEKTMSEVLGGYTGYITAKSRLEYVTI